MPDLMSFDKVTYMTFMTWLAMVPDLTSFEIVFPVIVTYMAFVTRLPTNDLMTMPDFVSFEIILQGNM